MKYYLEDDKFLYKTDDSGNYYFHARREYCQEWLLCKDHPALSPQLKLKELSDEEVFELLL